MYKINEKETRIERIEPESFANLNYKERDHLQEWIANEPDSLGEKLLIIQKEYNGFSDTNERLDLLAIDTQGQLVVIENKRDNSGRNVTWQALKYASYCASFQQEQIVKIYQQYLMLDNEEEAEAQIAKFLDVDDLTEIELNKVNSQRIILVAGDFPIEVTSTALWLIDRGIDIKCIKVTPFQYGGEHFLTVNSIIPVPEIQQFKVTMQEAKENAMATEDEIQKQRYLHRLLDFFRENGCHLFDRIPPNKAGYIKVSCGTVPNCYYELSIKKSALGVGFGMYTNQHKKVFKHLEQQSDDIDETFGQVLEWHNKNDKSSKILFFNKAINWLNEEEWQSYIKWHLENMTKLEMAIKPHLKSFRQ